ncbi:TlpA disulfide reductase family protein [Chitinimonas sp. BJYL2]|uniref:TlpA family protein disulfide reductase n=1 Tax=Chitinimonas sp. BJYL2 TaxID=2976696 RepID=UPI0022B4FD6B|nr:TlpA disulfide reductase family protein [Chitinimonas sp. BJYL2]
MKRSTTLITGVVIIAAALAAGIYTRQAQLKPQPEPLAANGVAKPTLWQSGFKDLKGQPQVFSQWQGKPLVVNFWATWCAPCREEIPEFIATQNAVGDKVRFVGLAIDNAADVQKFVDEYKINYPVLVGEQDAMELMRTEGNRVGALPFTVIYDAAGKQVAAHPGRLTQAQLDALLKPFI